MGRFEGCVEVVRRGEIGRMKVRFGSRKEGK